jgi:hypothetical protein
VQADGGFGNSDTVTVQICLNRVSPCHTFEPYPIFRWCTSLNDF